jgi:hypothetical protein
MPKYGPHLPHIQTHVHDKLRELKLTPSYVFDSAKHQERFYTAPCRTPDNKKVVFKMRTEDFQETQEYFRREIRINELFTRFYKESRVLTVPLYLDGDAKHVPEWMAYEFIVGNEAGDFYNGFEQRSASRLSVPDLVAGMRNMHAMSAFAKGEIALEREGYAEHVRSYMQYAPRLRPFFTAEEIEAGRRLLEEGQALLDAQCELIVHGDFHPGNIILKEDGGVAFIDWYDVHLNNCAYDLAYLLLEIPDPSLRAELIECFEEGEKDKDNFRRLLRLDILRLAPRKIGVLGDALFKNEPTKEDYRKGLTEKGLAKLEINLDFFRRALEDKQFIQKS